MAGRRLYLVAAAGYPNYGDEIIAAQWLRYLAQHEPDAEIWVDCHHPGGAELLLGHLHPHVRFVDTLWTVGWAAPSDDPEEVAAFTAQTVRQPGFGEPRRAAGIELLHTVDSFHAVGGAHLTSLWPRHMAVLSAGATLAEEFGVRSSATGLGLVPAMAEPALLDRLGAGYAVLDVRDAQSRALFTRDDVSASGDDTLIDIGEHLYDQRDSRSLMLSFQTDLVDAGVEALAESALQTISAWGVGSGKIGYVEALPDKDRRVFELLEPSLPDMRFYPFTEVWRDGLPARRGQRWLTTRYHVHLLAAARGAWGVVFPARTGYSDVKHESLISSGSRWAMAEPGQPAGRAHGEAGFGGALPPLIAAKQAVAARVYDHRT